jgi:hypothetical protein
MVLGGWSS